MAVALPRRDAHAPEVSTLTSRIRESDNPRRRRRRLGLSTRSIWYATWAEVPPSRGAPLALLGPPAGDAKHATWPCRGQPSLLISDSRASRTDCRCYNSQVPWRRELAGTDAPVFSQLDRVSRTTASDVGCSAFHASRGRGGASPRFCVDARLDVLGPVDMCSPPRRRHACKVLLGKRRSRPFLDL